MQYSRMTPTGDVDILEFWISDQKNHFTVTIKLIFMNYIFKK